MLDLPAMRSELVAPGAESVNALIISAGEINSARGRTDVDKPDAGDSATILYSIICKILQRLSLQLLGTFVDVGHGSRRRRGRHRRKNSDCLYRSALSFGKTDASLA
jgi:hypothetical protein